MNPVSRRKLLGTVGTSTLLTAFQPLALAAPRPASVTPDMSLMVPGGAGGGWDVTARALGQALLASGSAARVRYEVRSGAAGTIGLAQFASEHRADPHALLVMGSVMLGGILSGKPPVTLDAVTPIARLSSEYNVIVVPVHSPWRDMRSLLAQFKTQPGSIRWGGGSRGAAEHIVLGLLAQSLGQRTERVNYVPFRGGGEAAAALISGGVMAASSGISEFMPYINKGLMRPLAVTSPARLIGLDVPTLLELGHDVVFGNWRGVYGAPQINASQRQQLIERVEVAVRHSSWKTSLQQHQWQHSWLAGDAFAQFVQQDMQAMARVMQSADMH